MEADEVNVVAGAVLGDFEEIKDAEEAGFAGESGSDVGEADGLDGVNDDGAFSHGVATANFDVRASPDTDAASDFAAANAFAKALGEHHPQKLITEDFRGVHSDTTLSAESRAVISGAAKKEALRGTL